MNIDEIKKRYPLDPDVDHIHIAKEDYEWLIAEVDVAEKLLYGDKI